MIAYYIRLLGEGLTNFLVKNRTFLCKVRFSRLRFADYCAGVQVFASARNCLCRVVAHWRILYRFPSYILPSFFYHILYLLFL